jgi:hypothetical protein
MTPLKPCRFCGGSATRVAYSDLRFYKAGCFNENCLVMPMAYAPTQAEADAAWNTRAPPSLICYSPCPKHPWQMTISAAPPPRTVCPICEPPDAPQKGTEDVG